MTDLPALTLVLGGARSGKSAFAEARVLRAPRPVYVATGWAGDDEMSERIAVHRARRGARWQTVEAPLELGAALAAHSAEDCAVLIDCLTLWVSNLMHAERDLDAEFTTLLESLARSPGPVVLVSNEVGLGIVPENRLARQFRDAAGRLHQRVAAAADEVYLVVAGLPVPVKSCGPR